MEKRTASEDRKIGGFVMQIIPKIWDGSRGGLCWRALIEKKEGQAGGLMFGVGIGWVLAVKGGGGKPKAN